ncbi:MAG: TlpA family protein disulfide reductase [Bacteroides sp.]|nr:TlpA family protein disulfide reductase [Bacteroides sp.]
MKRTFIISLLVAMALSVQAQKRITVIGEVENVADSTVFDLMETDGTGATAIYTNDDNNGRVINGRFILVYKCSRTDSRHFSLTSSSKGFSQRIELDFWANQGDTVYIKGKGNLLGNWEVQSDATEQKEWDLIRRKCEQELETHQQAIWDYETYRSYRRNTEMNEEEWDKTSIILAQKDSIVKQTSTLWYKKQLEVMKHLPFTDFWMDHLTTILYMNQSSFKELEQATKDVYAMHAKRINQHPDGKQVISKIFPSSVKAERGKMCIDTKLFDTNGNEFQLADFRGKYILLDFWANYCGACLAAFPHIKKIQEQYADRLVIISISVDKVNTWKASPHIRNISWLNMNDGGGIHGGIAYSYDIKALPTYILISPEGIYKERLNDSMLFNGTLEKLINE